MYLKQHFYYFQLQLETLTSVHGITCLIFSIHWILCFPTSAKISQESYKNPFLIVSLTSWIRWGGGEGECDYIITYCSVLFKCNFVFYIWVLDFITSVILYNWKCFDISYNKLTKFYHTASQKGTESHQDLLVYCENFWLNI